MSLPYRFEFIDHTADVAVRALGRDLPEAFAAAARAMFEVLADLDDVQERRSREVEVSSDSVDTLLVDWLNELLFLFETERLLLTRFEVRLVQEASLKAIVLGEPVDPSRHRMRMGIKAVTYHMLEVRCGASGCEATVVFDV